MSSLKAVLNPAIQILGFDPKSPEEVIFKIYMTPYMARYILDHHNEENRKFVPAQQNAISKSWTAYGWMFDAGVCAFNTDGNLSEFQHRLGEIAARGETVPVWCATGVKPSTFTRTAPAKNRTKWDAVYKTDNSATSSEVTALEQLLKRRKGKKLSMTNAPEMFKKWNNYIRIAMSITNEFFGDDKVKIFDPWQRQFNSWATLMVSLGYGTEAIAFLALLKSHLTGTTTCKLFDGFDGFFRSKSVAYIAGEKKAEQVHFMLCYATDRFLTAPEGNCLWDLDYVDSNHEKMMSKSPTYFSFLDNPHGFITQSFAQQMASKP